MPGASDEAAYTTTRACRGCGRTASPWDVVFEMDPMPLAGSFPESAAAAAVAPRYPLTWVRCAHCGLVQVLEDVDDGALYGQYRYGSSTVPGLVRHFEAYAAFLGERLGDGPRTVLEIGCNDGVLLDRLPSDWRLIGVDPSDVARDRSDPRYRLVNAPFDRVVAAGLAERGTVDLVTSSNAMAHFSRLREAIEAAWEILAPGGEFFVEVHDLDSTLGSGQWDTVYHEHKVEWSERSLVACFGEVGFELVHLERLALHGGLIRAGFRKIDGGARGIEPPPRESFARLQATYRDRRRSEPVTTLRALHEAGARIAAYGAAGRANVWLNQLPELPFEWIVDGSPLRAGRWIPSVVVPIVLPARLDEDPPEACLITAWNYAPDIRARHPGFTGHWLQTFDEDAVDAG